MPKTSLFLYLGNIAENVLKNHISSQNFPSHMQENSHETIVQDRPANRAGMGKNCEGNICDGTAEL